MDTNNQSQPLKYKKIDGDDEHSHEITEWDQMRARSEDEVSVPTHWIGQTPAFLRSKGWLMRDVRIWTPVQIPVNREAYAPPERTN